MWSLSLSFFITNLTHGYLLYSHKGTGQPTLSERAVQSNTSLGLFVTAHIIAGLAFASFAYQFFWLRERSVFLLSLALLGIIAEWLQAVMPAKGRYERLHFALAFTMSIFMVALGITAILSITLPTQARLLLIAIEVIILAGYPLVKILPYKYFWIIQITNINLFYLQMYILLFVS